MDSKQKGWCKLYKVITFHAVFKNAEHFKLFVWLVLNAAFTTHKEEVGTHILTVFRGELYVACKELAEVMEVTPRMIRYYLIDLKDKYDVIQIEKYKQFYKIIINNYNKYQ